MSDILDILKTPEYQQYSKRFKASIGFNMCVDVDCLENKAGALFSLEGMSCEECLALITSSIAQKKDLLQDHVKENKVSFDATLIY